MSTMTLVWGGLSFTSTRKLAAYAAEMYMTGGDGAAPDLADYTEADAASVASEAMDCGWFADTDVTYADAVDAFAALFERHGLGGGE